MRPKLLCLLLLAAFALPVLRAKGGTIVNPITVRELKELIGRDSGKVVLVNVWATWCKWCKEEMPSILALKKKLGPRGFTLVLVSADDPDILNDGVKPELRRLGIDFPSYIIAGSTDDEFIAGMNENWSGALPTSFIFDRRGSMVEMLVGEKTRTEFEEAIGKYLK